VYPYSLCFDGFLRGPMSWLFFLWFLFFPTYATAITMDLNDLVAKAGTQIQEVSVSNPFYILTANLTVPATAELIFPNDGMVACNGFTLTIQSSTTNWPGRQIFASDCSSTGSVSFAGNQISREVIPEWWGAKADNSRDNQAELQATGVAAATGSLGVRLGVGTYKHSGSLLWLRSGLSVKGVNNQVTVLSYTGAGSQITTVTSGVRVFRTSFQDLWLSTVTGTVGLALDSVSEGEFRNILLTGSSVACLDIFGATPGNSVYNRFYNVKAQGCGIGHRVQGISHNGNVWIGSRANACTRGWEITDSNDNSLIGVQSEANSDVGVYIDATVSGYANRNRIISSRLENNTNYGVTIASVNVIETFIEGLWTGSNGADFNDVGTRTNRAPDLLYVTSAGNMAMKSGAFVAGTSFFTQGSGSYTGATSTSALVKGQVADNASAVGVKLSNTVTLTTSGAKAVEACSDSTCATPVAAVRYNGTTWGLRLQSPDGTWYLLTIANGGTVSVVTNP
jgi:hypothetical protein